MTLQRIRNAHTDKSLKFEVSADSERCSQAKNWNGSTLDGLSRKERNTGSAIRNDLCVPSFLHKVNANQAGDVCTWIML